MGLLFTGFVVLAWMITWNFLIRSAAAQFTDSPAARGALFVV